MKTGLLVIAALGMATSATAATTTDNPFAANSAVLRLDGIDLSTADGQQRLAIRMDQAATAVCGDRLSSVHLALGERARECKTAVIADIRTQVESKLASAAKASSTQLASN